MYTYTAMQKIAILDYCKNVLSHFSHVQLCDPQTDCSHELLCLWNFSSNNICIVAIFTTPFAKIIGHYHFI